MSKGELGFVIRGRREIHEKREGERERESKGKRNNMRRERGRERETEEVINLIKSLHVATLQKHAHTHTYM